MPYEFELTETLEHKLKKLQTKNKVLLIACRKKINEIIQIPESATWHKELLNLSESQDNNPQA